MRKSAKLLAKLLREAGVPNDRLEEKCEDVFDALDLEAIKVPPGRKPGGFVTGQKPVFCPCCDESPIVLEDTNGKGHIARCGKTTGKFQTRPFKSPAEALNEYFMQISQYEQQKANEEEIEENRRIVENGGVGQL